MKFTFGDIVIIEGENIGVVVKSWLPSKGKDEPTYEIYSRMDNKIKTFYENEIERYMVRHKYLSEEEKEYQQNAIDNK